MRNKSHAAEKMMQETEPVLLFDSCCCTASLLLPTIERLGLFADKPERETADAVATLRGDMRSEMSTCSRTTPEEELKLLVRSKRWYSRGATMREAVEDSTPTHCRKELGGTST